MLWLSDVVRLLLSDLTCTVADLMLLLLLQWPLDDARQICKLDGLDVWPFELVLECRQRIDLGR